MKQRHLWVVMLCFLAGIIYLETGKCAAHSLAAQVSVNEDAYQNIKVVEVLRGDTVRLENGELLHLIGVSAPECKKTNKRYGDSKMTGIPESVLEVMGNEVIQFTRNLIENKYICVEFDVEQRDQYGTLMGYVFLPEEDVFVNAEIIRQGYTSGIITSPNDRYKSMFMKLYTEAKQRSEGIWRQWQRE